MSLLLLLASLATAQSNLVLPVEDFSKDGAVQAVQNSLDDKFSVRGGTVVATASVNISSVMVNEICWVGGTCQTSAASAPDFLSTTTVVPTDQSVAQSSYFACLNSTVSLVTTGGKILLIHSGSARTDVQASIGMSVLMDGDYVTGDDDLKNTSTTPMAFADIGVTTYASNMGFTFLQKAPSAASHSWCLAGLQTGGGTFYYSTLNGSPANFRFTVMELK